MYLHIHAVHAVCPHCGHTVAVALPEADLVLPYWTVCAGQHGCGHGFEIETLSLGAAYDTASEAPTLSLITTTRP